MQGFPKLSAEIFKTGCTHIFEHLNENKEKASPCYTNDEFIKNEFS